MNNTPLKIRRESDNKLSNSELNNLRFECDPSENRKILLKNSSSLLSVSQENKQKDLAVYEFIVQKSPNKSPNKGKINKKLLFFEFTKIKLINFVVKFLLKF